MKIQDIQKEQKDKPCWNCKYFKGAYLEGVTFDCEVLGDNQLWSYIDSCEHFKHRGGEMRSAHEISLELDDKQKERISLDDTIKVLEQEILSYRYEIDKLRVLIREKDMTLVKAKFGARKIDAEIKILTREFWSAKNQGL